MAACQGFSKKITYNLIYLAATNGSESELPSLMPLYMVNISPMLMSSHPFCYLQWMTFAKHSGYLKERDINNSRWMSRIRRGLFL